MKLAISNIGWAQEDDERVYASMKARGFTGLEIAPTRLFPHPAYVHTDGAAAAAGRLRAEYGLCVPSMQSIWFGRTEQVFGTPEERRTLAEYTCRAVDFARAVGCPSLVFGCPRNRSMPQGASEQTAIDFFAEIGDYAARSGCVIALEANPPVYNTNFMNTTAQAFAVASRCGAGVAVNLDIGTVLTNGESLDGLAEKLPRVSHIHLSEPGLAPIERRPLHRELAAILRDAGYDRYISIEMKTQPFEAVCAAMDYVAGLFG